MQTDEKYMKEAVKQAKKAYAIGDVPIGCVIVAEDAESALKERVIGAAESAGVPVKSAPSMAWLGDACGIEVGAAAVGIGVREA